MAVPALEGFVIYGGHELCTHPPASPSAIPKMLSIRFGRLNWLYAENMEERSVIL